MKRLGAVLASTPAFLTRIKRVIVVPRNQMMVMRTEANRREIDTSSPDDTRDSSEALFAMCFHVKVKRV